MTAAFSLLLLAYLFVLLVLAYPLGLYLARLAEAKPINGLTLINRFEQRLYRLCGSTAAAAMSWQRYTLAIVLFNGVGVLFVYGVQRLQAFLPLNPMSMNNVSSDSAFNTAVSFVTNTNWQGYSGETTMSYLTQTLALAGQQFFSAATSIAVALALIRGFASHASTTIGNAWVDVTRVVLYVLLPLSLVLGVVLMSEGVIQNFLPYRSVALIEAVTYQQPKLDQAGQPLSDASGKPLTDRVTTQVQTLAMGPVASFEAIKMLGTNGGGFFNANSAHPYENPSPLTNALSMLAIFLIPAALCFTFGRLVGDMRQGWALLAVMIVLFVAMASLIAVAEQQGHPHWAALPVDQTASALQSGGNMEGKETRFGIAASALFAAITTAASCGAVNTMHDSLMPLGGLGSLLLMQLGEVVFGGVGSGLYGMLIFALMTVFIAGLMIGRTPEYLGKKIQVFEMKMVAMVVLVTPTLVLAGTALAAMTEAGRAGIGNPGAHGFSELLYALTSAANNNGSAFAGLSANTPFYNIVLAVVMWFGRFAVIVAVLAIAGSLAAKKRLDVTVGTLPTHGPMFVMMLLVVVVMVGVLNYVPALALGPIVEHLHMMRH